MKAPFDLKLQISIALSFALLFTGLYPAEAGELDRSGQMYSPFLEWSLENPSWDGNPFDVEATATFTHQDSGEVRRTHLFHDGKKTWKFRFTATRAGTWTFRTSSDDADLNGKAGTVTVRPNPGPKARGFLVPVKHNYAWQMGENGEPQPFVPNLYMNLVKFGVPERCGWTAVRPTFSNRKTFAAYLDEAEEHGCNGVFARMGNQWFRANAVSYQDHDSEDPDPETFRAMERAIVQAHGRGMFLHIWAWGDEARKWTPVGVAGGVNGKADRRLQRYMAARLGPVPGWTMSYGSDLNEWVRPEQVASWAEYITTHSGWKPMLSARSVNRNGERFKAIESLPVASYDDGPKNFESPQGFYRQARERLGQTPPRPVLFEQRFSYLRHDFWNMDATRRAFWQFALAGGAASIWGHYPAEGRCVASFQGDYPQPNQLRTHRKFWRGRLLAGMEPANELSRDKNTLVLRSGNDHALFYREGAESIHLDLSGLNGPQGAIAIDTTKDYAEIDLGSFQPGEHTWKAPSRSDWAIAIGEFPGRSGSENNSPAATVSPPRSEEARRQRVSPQAIPRPTNPDTAKHKNAFQFTPGTTKNSGLLVPRNEGPAREDQFGQERCKGCLTTLHQDLYSGDLVLTCQLPFQDFQFKLPFPKNDVRTGAPTLMSGSPVIRSRQPEHKGTQTELAYQLLRSQILGDELRPGTIVSERMLAERLKMGKAPIRTAIQRLATEGFITIEARRGIVISPQSIQDIIDLYQLRNLLEPVVARKVAGTLHPEQIDLLRANLDEMRIIADTAAPTESVGVDFKFHRLLCGFSGNRQFALLLDRILDSLYREIRLAQVAFPDRIWNSLRDHEEIAEAVIAGDGEEAERRMASHLKFGEEFVMSRKH